MSERRIVNSPKVLEGYARHFLLEISKAMSLCKVQEPAHMAIAALDQVYSLVASDDDAVGFVVYNDCDQALAGTDLFFDAVYEEYTKIMAAPWDFNQDNISFLTIKKSRLTFLGLLAKHVLGSPLPDTSTIRSYVLTRIADVFNGNNPHHLSFELIFVDEDFEEGHVETTDLADLLIVYQRNPYREALRPV